jgi:hypothetical protein
MDMVESRTKNKEANIGNIPQGEISSRYFSSKKHVFNKSPREVYQSKEDLANQYPIKVNLSMSEIRDFLLEVERISYNKSSLFSVRDV